MEIIHKESPTNQLLTFIDLSENSIAQLSIDCVIFGFQNNELKVLLCKYPDMDLWALQGGHIQQNEDIDSAAERILYERTGLKDIYLSQFHVFGKANRNPTMLLKPILDKNNINIEHYSFSKKRVISIGYYSLVNYLQVTPSVGPLVERSAWFDIQNLPILVPDHGNIIEKALEIIRQRLDYHLVGFNLMQPTFTMKELQRLYENILGEPLQRTSFQDKILALNILERLDKQFNGKAHKAPYLYRFKK